MRKLTSKLVPLMLGTVLFCLAALSANAQESRTVTGKIVDEKGEALIGAGILSKDGKRGSVSDIDGKYTVNILPSDEVLVFTYLGYATQEIQVNGKTTIDVIMVPDTANQLNDVVVIGYGTTKKQDLTGSVATVKMSDIADSPVLSVDQALQGRIAGMDVMSTSGDPTSTTSIRIRGTRSIEASNEPLIVVDGVMDAVSDIGDINPDDIESISVMKDASSTAIYGSRGANGVIIITTKKGITDKPTVRLKATFGVSQLAKNLDLMNAEEFIRYRNDYYWFRNDQNPEMTAIKDIAKYPNDVDWVKAITRLAPYQNYQLTVSGNSKGNNYYGSLSFVDDKGIIMNTGQTRVTGRFNFSKDFTSWLNAGLKAYTSYRRSDLNKAYIGGTNTSNGAMYLPPITGLLDIHNPLFEEGSLINTPYASSIYEDYYKDSWINTISIDATAKITKHLTFKTQNTLYTGHGHTYHFWPNTLPKRLPEEGADALKHEFEQVRLTSENTLTYKRKFNRYHNFDAMLGYSVNLQTNKNTDVKARGLILDELKWNNLNGISSKDNYDINSGYYEILRQSVFGRVNYNYRSRYYITATLRADGSSNFASNRKWGFFPSAAFKWNIKKEPFMKKAKWLDDLSLRASAGRTGNDAIAAYRSLQAYDSTTDGYIFNGAQGVSYYPSRLENPNLTWEKTDQYSLALESAFLKNRIRVELEGYYSRTSDLLLSVQTIASTGYTSRFQNLGLTSNKGVEFSIETRNIEKKTFGWTTTFTISRNAQMVENIGAEEYLAKINAPVSGIMMYGYKAGYPLNALWGLVDAGCFHNVAEVAANQDPSNPDYHKYICYGSTAEPGLQRVVDQNRDGSVGMDDVVYLGQADPEFYGGLQNNFTIGNFKIGIFFNYSVGGAIYNYAELYMGGSYRSNQYRYMLDSWHPLRNPNSDTPRAGGSQVMLPSSRFVHDASYLRLKEVNLQYTFDFKKNKSNPVVKSLTLGLTGNNLFLWSSYNGFDPDVSSESDDSTLRRVDMNAYPSSRKVVLNVSLKF